MLKNGRLNYMERWVLAYLRARYASPDSTAANIHAALADLGICARSGGQSTRRALYELERAGLVEREDAGAVWLWSATDASGTVGCETR